VKQNGKGFEALINLAIRLGVQTPGDLCRELPVSKLVHSPWRPFRPVFQLFCGPSRRLVRVARGARIGNFMFGPHMNSRPATGLPCCFWLFQLRFETQVSISHNRWLSLIQDFCNVVAAQRHLYLIFVLSGFDDMHECTDGGSSDALAFAV
jgi:hypothetical protein